MCLVVIKISHITANIFNKQAQGPPEVPDKMNYSMKHSELRRYLFLNLRKIIILTPKERKINAGYNTLTSEQFLKHKNQTI